jgi:hypothetical protein
MNVKLDPAPEALNRRHRPAAAIRDPPSPGATPLEAEKRAGIDREHGGGEKGFQVLPHDLVEDGTCRIAGRVPQGRNGRRTMLAGRGFVSHDDVMTVTDGDGIAASR